MAAERHGSDSLVNTPGSINPNGQGEESLQEAGNQAGSATSSPYSDSSLTAFMSAVAVDVANDWQTRFQEAGDTWQTAHYNFVQGNQTADSPCGIAGDPDDFQSASNPPNPAFACSSDLTVYISVDWVRDHIWNNGADPTGVPDTMGVGAVIAHEFFHIVQDQLGITLPAGAQDVAPIELQADCGAGVWANDKYHDGQLQGNDVSDAEATMSSVGDEEFFNESHHGTPDQRKAAFALGYNTGEISQCTLTLDQTLPMFS